MYSFSNCLSDNENIMYNEIHVYTRWIWIDYNVVVIYLVLVTFVNALCLLHHVAYSLTQV